MSLVDEAERDDGDTGNGVSRPSGGGRAGGRRRGASSGARACTLARGCAVCDYLVDGETAADVVERCEEVLRWKPPGGRSRRRARRGARRERGGAAREEDVDAGQPNPNATRASSKGEDGGSNAGEASARRISSYATYLAGAGAALVAAALADLALGDLVVVARVRGGDVRGDGEGVVDTRVGSSACLRTWEDGRRE